MKRIPALLDVDTGTDDAVAIILAHRISEISLLGITTVAGNKSVRLTTENTLRVCDLIQSDIPVYAGAALPMVATLTPERRPDFPREGNDREDMAVHPDYLPLPQAKKTAEEEDAVSAILRFLREAKKERQKIRVITCGPLTNWGLALRAAPNLVDQIESFHIMGGGYRETNCTASAEFNIWADPEAAEIVFQSPVPICLCTLDATHSASLPVSLVEELDLIAKKEARFIGTMIRHRLQAYNQWQPMENPFTVPIHDALPIAAMADPLIYQSVVSCPVRVDCGHSASDGRTVIDVAGKEGRGRIIDVVLSADSRRFSEVLVHSLKGEL